jgi:hypothetical protein
MLVLKQEPSLGWSEFPVKVSWSSAKSIRFWPDWPQTAQFQQALPSQPGWVLPGAQMMKGRLAGASGGVQEFECQAQPGES